MLLLAPRHQSTPVTGFGDSPGEIQCDKNTMLSLQSATDEPALNPELRWCLVTSSSTFPVAFVQIYHPAFRCWIPCEVRWLLKPFHIEQFRILLVAWFQTVKLTEVSSSQLGVMNSNPSTLRRLALVTIHISPNHLLIQFNPLSMIPRQAVQS